MPTIVRSACFREASSYISGSSYSSRRVSVAIDNRTARRLAEGKDFGDLCTSEVGQGLRELGIQPIFAPSLQDKGRIERLFNTLQDHLVQELRLAGIITSRR
jgi:hypothetical protein